MSLFGGLRSIATNVLWLCDGCEALELSVGATCTKMNGVAPAFTVRYSHEYLIWYYKEKMLPIAKEQQGKFMTVFSEKAREHSRKPEYAYKMIEALYPNENRIDVFSREKREGWCQFGNQTDHF